jgi:hypothetical protein
MKTVIKLVVLMLVILSVSSVFAVEKSITVNTATNLNGQAIAPGDYKVSYEVKGSTAEVKFMQGSKVVAKATGEVRESTTPAPYSGIIDRTNTDGTRTLVEVQFSKQKSSIRFDTDTAVGK